MKCRNEYAMMNMNMIFAVLGHKDYPVSYIVTAWSDSEEYSFNA